jgi:hypothetical protein
MIITNDDLILREYLRQINGDLEQKMENQGEKTSKTYYLQ